jgi:uncharacterized protein YllA (UPF0747 family)
MPRHGESLAAPFTRFLVQAFGARGLLVFEPDWLRAPIGRALARAVAARPLAALVEGSRALAAQSVPVAIDLNDAVLAYRFEGDLRTAARTRGTAILIDGNDTSLTEAELAAAIASEPARWSPAALLRPVVQDLVLPVAAYVGGTGELAYHAQLASLRRSCRAPDTPFVPRLSCTIIDSAMRDSLQRLGLSVAEAARSGVPPRQAADDSEQSAVAAALRARAHEIAGGLLEVGPALAAQDPGLAVQLKQVAAQVRQLVERLATKAERVHANNAGKGRRHERRIHVMFRPQGLPQERVLSTLYALARWGSGWLDELVATAAPIPSTHIALHLDVDAADRAEAHEP